MARSITSAIVAALAIGVSLVILFVIFPLPSLQIENQIVQLNSGISGRSSGLQMFVPDGSDLIYATWVARVGNESDSLLRLYFSQSQDGGMTFSQPIAFATSTRFQGLEIATQGRNIYATWHDQGDIFFVKSNDGGQTFSNTSNISNSTQKDSSSAKLAATGESVFVTWAERTSDEADGRVLFRASNDNGTTFGEAVNLNEAIKGGNQTLSFSAGSPSIAASDQNLMLISWREYYPESDSVATKLAYSTDGGRMFAVNPVTLQDDPYSLNSIQADGDDIYLILNNDTSLLLTKGVVTEGRLVLAEPVRFSENYNAFGFDAQLGEILFEGENIYVSIAGDPFESVNYYFTSSSDGGRTFGAPQKLFGCSGCEVDMAASGDIVYIVRTNAHVHILGQSATAMHLLASTNGGNTFDKVRDIEAGQNFTLSSPNVVCANEPATCHLGWSEHGQNESRILFTKLRN